MAVLVERVRVVLNRRFGLVSAASLIIGGLLYFTGDTPWILVIVFASLSFRAFADKVEKSVALASTVIVIFCFESLVIRFAPIFSIDFHGLNAAALLCAGAALTFRISRTNTQSPLPEKSRRTLTPLGVLYGLVSALMLFMVVTGSRFMAWATNSDAVWTLVQARTLFTDNGMIRDSMANPAPLTGTLIASAFRFDQDSIESADRLAHEITMAGQLWLMVIIATALLVGHLVNESMQSTGPVLRWVGTLGSALLMFTWYFAGYATQFGFYNASIALCVLLSTWAVWNSVALKPGTQSLLLSGATLAMLATWAPLALAPALLIAFHLYRQRRTIIAHRNETVKTLTGFGVLAAYILGVAIPDLIKTGSALGADGGMIDIKPVHVLLVGLLSLAAVGALAKIEDSYDSLMVVGYQVLLLAFALGIGYLMLQRLDVQTQWGYYAAKFAWLATSLALVIGLQALGRLLGQLRSKSVRALTMAGGASALLVAMLLPGLPNPNVVFAPLTNIVYDEQTGRNSKVNVVSKLASYGQKNIAFGLSTAPKRDGELNLWLLQLNAMKESDPFQIRSYSYHTDGADETLTCGAIQVWGGNVTVHTSDLDNVTVLRETCGSLQYSVVVHDPLELAK